MSCRPDFQVLIYPGDIMKPRTSTNVSPECVVTTAPPPTFLVMAQNDPVHVENVLGYALSLQKAGVPRWNCMCTRREATVSAFG